MIATPKGRSRPSVGRSAVTVLVVALVIGVAAGLGYHQWASSGSGQAARPPVTLPLTALSPPGPSALNPAEKDLYQALPKPGIKADGCQGAPAAEGVSGVVAAMVCPPTTPALTQPVTFLRFASRADMDAFVHTRAALISSPGGVCRQGGEQNTVWYYGSGTGRPALGSLLCVHAGGDRPLAELDWTSNAQLTLVSVEASQLTTAYAWWTSPDGRQLPS